MTPAIHRWRESLAAWAIPEAILAAAPESPYGFPTEIFRCRAEMAAASTEPSPSARRALEALPEGGSVLDVGVGAGAGSLPLAGRASRITGVDQSEAMLEEFLQAAKAAGVEAETGAGSWPDVASRVAPADVVVCHHVLYNVPDLAPFVLALSDHARRRVVVEIPDGHPWSWMNDLWMTFRQAGRPDRDDAEAVLRELEIPVEHEDHVVPPTPGGFERRADAVALVRRRLCLTIDRNQEIVEALGDRLAERNGLWSAGPSSQTLVTLWWDRS